MARSTPTFDIALFSSMTLSPNTSVRSLLSPGSLLLVFALCGFVWVSWLKIQSERLFPGALHMPMFPYHQDMAFLLVLAAIGLIIKRRWSLVLSLLFSAVALYVVLVHDFLLISWGGELPTFSRLHFRLWWINFYGWKMFLALLATLALCVTGTRFLRPTRA